MNVRLYNTLTRQKEELVPLQEGRVGMYVCGVTVYDLSHIGHARCYVAFDVIRRWLMRSYEVKYVQNFTDVDDKIIARAKELGEEPLALSARYADEFHADMDALGILRADVEPKVSTHMEDILAFIEDLVEKGYAYRVPSSSSVEGAGDDVYFRVRRYERYTALSGRNLDDMCSGARVGIDERKEDPLDFALWKSAKEGELFWQSPFGKGRPGWHIECSAMSERHLGETFDLHGGGKDLVFPHHTNEIAQSECRHDGRPFSRYWMHNGFVDFAGEKMSKSLGNFFTIREVTQRYHPEALRYFLMTAHYRSPIGFDVQARCPRCAGVLSKEEQEALKHEGCGASFPQEEAKARVIFPGLEEAEGRVGYLYQTLRKVDLYLAENQPDEGDDLAAVFSSEKDAFAPWDELTAAMNDDFNTPLAIAALAEMLKVANIIVDAREKELIGRKLKPPARARLLGEWRTRVGDMLAPLGLGQREAAPFLEEQRRLRCRVKGIDPADVERLLERRTQARAEKNWAEADAVRAELTELGIEVRDTKTGAEWSVWG